MEFFNTVTLEKFVSQDKYQKRTYGTPTTLKCRMFQADTKLISGENAEAVSVAQIFFPPNTDVSLKDRITLPDGSQPYIQCVNPNYSEVTHKVVYVEVDLVSSTGLGAL